MSKGLDNKISNILGGALPEWLKTQIAGRSKYNSLDNRDDENILYLANKTAWIRMISSVNINSETDKTSSDIAYFKNMGVEGLELPQDLAKKYTLFGGTSQYLDNKNSLRYGLEKDGAYNLLGNEEIKTYGYRPMPGIQSATIETQGRLGSVKMATVSFKVWDKMQLDIIDSLYFKLGYTMLLEWGHTIYLKSDPKAPTEANRYSYAYSEFNAITDPLSDTWDKEKIQFQLSKNIRASDGNYDGMLGIVTNFNFTYNQEGGYDCTVKIISLGAIGDSLKINNTTTMPDIVADQIKMYLTAQAKRAAEEAAAKQIADINATAETKKKSLEEDNKIKDYSKSYEEIINDKTNKKKLRILSSNNVTNKQYYYLPTNTEVEKPINTELFAFSEFKDFLINQKELNNTTKVTIDFARLNGIINNASSNLVYNKNEANRESGIYKNTLEATNPEEIELNIKWHTSQKLAIAAFFNNDFKGQLVDLSYYDKNTNQRFNLKLTIPFEINLGGNSDSVQLFAQIKKTPSISTAELLLAAASSPLATIATAVGREILASDIPSTNLYNDTIRDQIVTVLKNKDTIWTIDSSGGYIDRIAENISNVTQGQELLPSFGIGYLDSKIILKLKTSIIVNIDVITRTKTSYNDIKTDTNTKSISVPIYLEIDDISLISSFTQSSSTIEAQSANLEKQKKDLIAATNKEKEAITAAPIDNNTIDTQVTSVLRYQSNLELAIRGIQYYVANKTLTAHTVQPIQLTSNEHSSMFKKLFSYGIFNPMINEIIANDIQPVIKNNDFLQLDAINRLKLFAKFGFNAEFMKGDLESLFGSELITGNSSVVNYRDLTTVYTIPYDTNNNTNISDINTVLKPVYIQLGFLLMILNDMCIMYETKKDGDINKPLVYIDYNPETNRCLTMPEQFTSDALKFIIPFQATFKQYQTSLFSNSVIDGNTILAPSGSAATELFDPRKDDLVSNKIPEFRTSGNAYSGKTMKILVNCEYILKIIEEYSANDGMNSVYLKPFLDQLLKDLNNYLGGVNIFRVSYNDGANCFSIVDDQIQPLLPGETSIAMNSITDELPVFGKTSIAKSLSIQTDISSKLSNMIAISANAESKDQVANSANAGSFGFINTAYTDRYIRLKTDGVSKTENAPKALGDSIRKTAQAFNETIKGYYNIKSVNKANAAAATNYYIEKMSNAANANPATRASAMIPVSVNLSTDGIAGFNMGSAFTIPEQILPYTYSSRAIPNIDKNKQKIAFATVGISHTIQDNVWDTSIRGNMILVKDDSVYRGGSILSSNEYLGTSTASAISLGGNSNAYKNTDTYKNNEAFRKKVEELAAIYQTEADFFYRVMYKESGLKANAALYKLKGSKPPFYKNEPLPNYELKAAGLIQFTPITVPNIVPSLEAVLQMTPEAQMDYVIKYFKQSGLKSPATKYTIYSTVFFPLALRHLDDPNWTIQSRDLSPETISFANEPIAKAAGKVKGEILNIADFIKYVDTI
jgi:hypothetical protein